jgi:hypothetical protein
MLHEGRSSGAHAYPTRGTDAHRPVSRAPLGISDGGPGQTRTRCDTTGARGQPTSINVFANLAKAHEVDELLKLRHSIVLDLSRRGILLAFKGGKHWRYRRDELEEWMASRREAA